MEKSQENCKKENVLLKSDEQSEEAPIRDKQLPVEAAASVYADAGNIDRGDNNDENDSWLNKFQHFLATKLKLSNSDEDRPKVLEELTVNGIAKYIKSGKCKHIITIAGAGISTSAGIPDFRSPGCGLYDNLSQYDLPHPEAIFDIGFFKINPKPFFVLAKELYPASLTPTASHYFIRLLHEKGLLLRHYTQNVDTLEHCAGIPPDKIVEAHGTFHSAHCMKCNKEYDQDWLKEQIFADNVPSCTSCEAVVKPDIVFFGENLPSRFFRLVDSDFRQCDLLIIMGTSLSVHPFASLINNVPSTCPRLLINNELVGSSSNPFTSAFRGLPGNCGLAIGSKHNNTDVGIIGDCDDGCRSLVKELGWKDEHEALMKSLK